MSLAKLKNQLRRLLAADDANHDFCPQCRIPFAVGELERIRDAVLDRVMAEHEAEAL